MTIGEKIGREILESILEKDMLSVEDWEKIKVGDVLICGFQNDKRRVMGIINDKKICSEKIILLSYMNQDFFAGLSVKALLELKVRKEIK